MSLVTRTPLALEIGPAGAFEQKVTVSPYQKTCCWPMNLTLISCTGFLVDFRPRIAPERALRITNVILTLSFATR
jgi:hypothetical protein